MDLEPCRLADRVSFSELYPDRLGVEYLTKTGPTKQM